MSIWLRKHVDTIANNSYRRDAPCWISFYTFGIVDLLERPRWHVLLPHHSLADDFLEERCIEDDGQYLPTAEILFLARQYGLKAFGLTRHRI